jgi:hypothetical protein
MNQLLSRSVTHKTQTKNHREYCVTRYLTLCTQRPCISDVTQKITLYRTMIKCVILGRKTSDLGTNGRVILKQNSRK